MYQGFYINLDRNVERRAALEANFHAVGAAGLYQRVAAVDGRSVKEQYPTELDPGNLGLWLTHTGIVEANRDSPAHLHILEDDGILGTHAVGTFRKVLTHLERTPDAWDLLFTDMYVPPHDGLLYQQLAQGMQHFHETGNLSLHDLQPVAFAGTTSLFVNRHSIAKYAELLENQWTQAQPIDIWLREQVNRGRLKAYVTMPFQTSVSRDNAQSDIRGDLDAARVVSTAYRRAFFQNADLEGIDAELQEILKGAELTPLASIYLKTVVYNISNRWKHF